MIRTGACPLRCFTDPRMPFIARRYEAFFVNYLNDTVLPALRCAC
eukprot:SAG31_NODE_1186_length_9492_cov_70.124987_13_plen_45_part_00